MTMSLKILDEIADLETGYKKRFGDFPEVSHPDVSLAEYAERIRKALESGEPIVDPTPPGILT